MERTIRCDGKGVEATAPTRISTPKNADREEPKLLELFPTDTKVERTGAYALVPKGRKIFTFEELTNPYLRETFTGKIYQKIGNEPFWIAQTGLPVLMRVFGNGLFMAHDWTPNACVARVLTVEEGSEVIVAANARSKMTNAKETESHEPNTQDQLVLLRVGKKDNHFLEFVKDLFWDVGAVVSVVPVLTKQKLLEYYEDYRMNKHQG